MISGGCLCGLVRYEVDGDAYNVTHCHCADCRRSSGAAFVTWASFRRRDFRIIRGKPKELSWAGRTRWFCAECGTPLVFMTAPDAEEVDVTVCSLDDPGAVTPQDHTWVQDRMAWMRIADGLPAYARAREGRPK